MGIFESKKFGNDKIDLTLSEVIDRYSSVYYTYVAYKKDGTVEVWIGTPKKETNDEKLS